ncbi:MAG: excinuclease ABC subunit C [Fusobacteriia bacterium 4572_132]|nr:MAG: excinuclease ABC subunit C [Fusobacteriia bacterium 4572_132]
MQIKNKLGLDNISKHPGVYLMKKKGKIIYIGKAKNLKKRIFSYFRKKNENEKKTKELVRNIEEIETIICKTEVDALILENNLIKKYKPKYNIMLKDEKTYPYIKITKEIYPRLEIIRSTKKLDYKNGEYFGPYTSGVYKLIQIVKKIFPIRDCNRNMRKQYEKPCLKYYMKMCIAPCIYKQKEKEYNYYVENLKEFLKGKNEELLKEFNAKMEKFSENMQYEDAIIWRDKIRELKKIQNTQISEYGKALDEDVFVLKNEGTKTFIYILNIRNGKIIGKNNQIINTNFERNEDLFENIFFKYYLKYPLPKKIILDNKHQRSEDLIFKWGKVEKKIKVKLFFPKIKSRHKELLEMAYMNLNKEIEEYFTKKKIIEAGINSLKLKLNLKKLPLRIECFDISNIQGKDAVASMSVAIRGRQVKKEYRKFKITVKDTPDDFKMMEEVLTRRYSKLNIEELPDLILVDGGKGQLGIAKKVLEEYNKAQYLDIIGIAKEEELIFKKDEKEPYRLQKSQEALKILQRLRDEAHRFGITYHRKLRLKRVLNSELDEIKGIGIKRKKELLKKFKSVERVKKASMEELKEIVSEKIAIEIKNKK